MIGKKKITAKESISIYFISFFKNVHSQFEDCFDTFLDNFIS